MTDFMKMDVFFVVATLAVVVLTSLASVALWYALCLLRALERIAAQVEQEAKLVIEDLDEARADAKAEGKKLLMLLRAFTKSAKRLRRGRS